MKAAAFALVLLLALACVADTQAAFCRTSAFAVPCSTLKSLKTSFWKQCGKANVKALTDFKQVGACCTVTQQVKDKATWDNVYIPCEHGSPAYLSQLKTKGDACISEQKKYEC